VTLRVITAADVERLLPMAACIELMAEALAALARGEVSQPLRRVHALPAKSGALVWMPAHRAGEQPAIAVKQLCFMFANPSRGLDAHQGAVLLFDGTTGEPRALLDAARVTAIRTAAVSALATRLLARDDAGELAIIGTGVQAERHLEAIPLVRPVRRVRVAGRTPERARDFVARRRGALALAAAGSVEEAVRGADIVVLATSARAPVLAAGWLSPGAHVNAVGASQPPARELDLATVAGAALFTDRRQSLDAEAAEWIDGLAAGAFGRDHLRAELGEVLLGTRPGRTSPEEITLFRSLGLATEDLFVAQHVYAAAVAAGAGTVVEL
jgi:ornithine cyclodeaminase